VGKKKGKEREEGKDCRNRPRSQKKGKTTNICITPPDSSGEKGGGKGRKSSEGGGRNIGVPNPINPLSSCTIWDKGGKKGGETGCL